MITILNNKTKQQKILLYIGLVILVLTSILPFILPVLLSQQFNGIDKTLWLNPFIISMGVIFFIYCICIYLLKNTSIKTSSLYAGAVIVYLSGIVIFIAIQRFTSGLHYLESYNEVMNIRLSQGYSIYPDLEEYPVGTVYTPLFFILGSLFHLLFPDGYGYGRIISLLSFFATAIMVYIIVKQQYKKTDMALWASALFLCTYVPMEKLYDFSCVDTLLMCIITIALYFFLKNSHKADAISLFFCGLACFTKQTAVFPFLAVFGTMLFSRRKICMYSPIIFWTIIGIVLLLITDGMAFKYLVTYPLAHGIKSIPSFSILFKIFGLQIFLWYGAYVYISKERHDRFNILFFVIFISSFMGLMKSGGWIQAMFPLEPILCIAAIKTLYNKRLLLYCQLIIVLFIPFSTLYPYALYQKPDHDIVDLVKTEQKDVWLPMESYLYQRCNKKEWDNFCALFGPGWAGEKPPKRLVNALKTQQFGLIIIRKNSLDILNYLHPVLKKHLDKNYYIENKEHLRIYRPKIL